MEGFTFIPQRIAITFPTLIPFSVGFGGTCSLLFFCPWKSESPGEQDNHLLTFAFTAAMGGR
jgi:hypothetical protein